MVRFTASLLLVLQSVLAIDNGLGRSPPMGWRSWNCYHQQISQERMTTAANAMVDKSRGVSLLEVGFENCGLDDYYQKCGAGAGGSFHNASGYPIIDLEKFPDMKAMTDHAHSIGLRMGWYGNNCGCNEHQTVSSWGPSPGGKGGDGIHHYEGDIQATIDFGFDGIKLDGCGEFRNLTTFAELINKTGKPILVEDCHWGGDGPGSWGDGGHLNTGPNKVSQEKWCPFNFFRTSGDISSNWGSMIRNLLTVDKHQPWDPSNGNVTTGPGCWAYPDMLEVGNLPSFEEDRAHFGAWVINSAPLILGHDLNNSATNDKIWPIVTNKAAIKVSQSFAAGASMHPGGLVATLTPSPPTPQASYYLYGQKDKQGGWSAPAVGASGPVKFTPPSYVGKAATAFKYADAPNVEVCIDFEGVQGNSELMLRPCFDGKASQQLKMETNGNLHLATSDGSCLAVEDFEGPGVVQYKCNTGENEEFVYDSASTSLCSKGGSGHEARCLSAKTTPPHGGSGGNNVLLYAKPQPEGAVAALVINNYDVGAPGSNHTVTIDFKEIRFTSTGKTSVYDVWEQEEVTILDAGASSFTTGTFGAHDSRFYVFSPVEA